MVYEISTYIRPSKLCNQIRPVHSLMFPLCFVIYPILNVLNSDCCITCKIAWFNKDIFIVFQETGFTKVIVLLATFTEGNNFNMHVGF